jgi:hypothetical protein
LIPWVGQRLASQQKEVRKGRLDEREYDQLIDELERMLPQIATWAHHTRPDLSSLSIADAMSQAAVFEDPGASSDAPQGEVIYRFADGWTIQDLTEPEQIFADGIHVQNCLRKDRYGPSYAAAVRDGVTKIFSLRKKSGIPVISIEYNVPNKSFKQIYAKQNTPLGINLYALLKQDKWRDRPDDARILWENIQQYKPRIAEFLTALGADAGAFIMADAPLPAGLKSVEGTLDLRDYNHPLPASLKIVGRTLDLRHYNHPLPAGLKSVGNLRLSFYNHPLPAGLEIVTGDIYGLDRYNHPLPAGLTSVGRNLNLEGYNHPLPEGLTSVGGLYLSDYDHPLPASLTRVEGNLNVSGYNHPLPAGITSVGGDLNLCDYNYPLPAGLKSVGGLYLYGYKHPLPAGLTSVGGYLNLGDYNYPLPLGLRVKGAVVGAERYPYEIPGRRPALKPNRRRTSRPGKSRRKTSRSKRRTSRS